jgi:hypothetical protein
MTPVGDSKYCLKKESHRLSGGWLTEEELIMSNYTQKTPPAQVIYFVYWHVH